MNSIFTVTAIGIRNQKDPEKIDLSETGLNITSELDGDADSRCWGWYEHFSDAQDATVNNVTDMNEAGYYPWIVIEEVTEGILPITRGDKQTWYFFDRDSGLYDKLPEIPERFKRSINWSFG